MEVEQRPIGQLKWNESIVKITTPTISNCRTLQKSHLIFAKIEFWHVAYFLSTINREKTFRMPS